VVGIDTLALRPAPPGRPCAGGVLGLDEQLTVAARPWPDSGVGERDKLLRRDPAAAPPGARSGDAALLVASALAAALAPRRGVSGGEAASM